MLRRISLVVPYAPVPSETFIRAHIELLPADIALIYGWPPRAGKRPIISTPRRLFLGMRKRLAGAESATTVAYVEAFRRHNAALVLAEYGPTAVLVMRACRLAGIPLIAHFHGFDASVKSVIEEHTSSYRELFDQAAAVIAVSRAMERKLIEIGAAAHKVHY